MQPLISIIIPVYNHAQELVLALASIKKQTYKNIEIIIEKDLLHEGAPVMRNKGLAKARGEYVIFWDADVVAVPQMLEKMSKVLQENFNASYVYCDYKLQVTSYKLQKIMQSQIFDSQKLMENNFIHSTSLVRRKDAIKWDESLKRFQDWDLWLTMSEQNKSGIYLPEVLFTIISKGSISSWLPSFAYKKPWCYFPGIRDKVMKYEAARKIIIKKHAIDL